MGRPRKYANDAEKMAAFRARWGRLTVDIEPLTVDTVARIALFYDVSQSEVVNQALKFAFTNHPSFQMTGAAFPYKRMLKQNPG